MNTLMRLTISLLTLATSAVSIAQSRQEANQAPQTQLVENCRDHFLNNPDFRLENMSRANKQRHCACVAGLVVAEARENARANIPETEVSARIHQMNRFFLESANYVSREGENVIFELDKLRQDELWFPAIMLTRLGQCSAQAPRSQNP